MRPDADTNNAFVYCLAEAAQKFGIRVLFTMAHSNHHHTGIHDPHGNYPQFLERFHRLFAKCQNALRGRWENFWASEATSVVRLVDPSDVLDKMVYALTNPVKDHVVEKAHHWPGVSSLGAGLAGRTVTATRPRHFFRQRGSMPAVVTLGFAPLPGFEHLSHAELTELIEKRVRAVEEAAARERGEAGRRVLGRARVLRQRWNDRPESREPRGKPNHCVAAGSKWSRVEALLRNKAFQVAYAAARAAFRAGVRDVLFPAGTYWLRRFADVRIAPVDESPKAR